MKKSIFLIAVMLMAVVSLSAQESVNKPQAKQKPTAEQIAKHRAERMRKELLLGNDQYDKVYKICLKQAKEQIKRMEQMERERKQMSAEMKDILNEAQYERFEEMQQPQRHNFRGGKGKAFMYRMGIQDNQHRNFQHAPEVRFHPQPNGQIPIEFKEEQYGDPKRNKNMYYEPKQEAKKSEE